MKRDFELIRKLLIFLEEKEDPGHVEVPPIEGYSESVIKTHLILLHDAGLLRCEPVKSSTSDRVIYVIPFDLTWEGHEFLGKIRDDNVWNKIKNIVSSRGGTLVFSVVNRLATHFATETIKNV